MDENDTRIADSNKSLIAFAHGFQSHMFQGPNVDLGKCKSNEHIKYLPVIIRLIIRVVNLNALTLKTLR